MTTLLYTEEHLSCVNNKSDSQAGFKYAEIMENESLYLRNKEFHYIIFLLDGDISINCNEFRNNILKRNQFILISKTAESHLKTLTPCKVLLFSFSALKTVCEKQAFQSYWKLYPKIQYKFTPLSLRDPLTDFLDLLKKCLTDGIDCTHLHDLKHQELFLLLRAYYEKEELANFFYPIVGKSFDFRSLIMENYLKVHRVDELASLSGMGRTNFDNKFKEEFGISPHQWILKQKAKHVRHSLAEPNCIFSDIMRKYNFNSATHFTRFCKQQFGCTPTELMKQLQE
ncbi:MAG: AraC family transcriptional regulator [Tannerellaceae bacterium]|jgi:AraC-like DNA-binding protein|nr:AraC family transcriptional regulator [Tannerellaceae bacterium]